ncbi:MAG: hypothetical protein WCJ35_12475 [Planctomycetota bacterium]
MKITLSFPPCGTDIPYFDATEFDPNERHEYVDLRSNPGGVNDLPEIRHAPRLKDFLLAINGNGTFFRTFGCNYVLFPEETIETEHATRTITPAAAHSYVHVGFADISRCENLDDYYRLCGRLSKHLYEQAEFQGNSGEADGAAKAEFFQVELSIESLRMENQDKGHALAISCHVQGWTEDEARQRWLQLMSVVSGFLAREDRNGAW